MVQLIGISPLDYNPRNAMLDFSGLAEGVGGYLKRRRDKAEGQEGANALFDLYGGGATAPSSGLEPRVAQGGNAMLPPVTGTQSTPAAVRMQQSGSSPGRGLSFVSAPGGTRASVAASDAHRFQGLFDDLEAAGYPIKADQTGGYNDRNIAGTHTRSQHAYGRAVDVNWTDNPRGAAGTIPPELARSLAEKHGLTWGGDWRNPDPMHFEVRGSSRSAPVSERGVAAYAGSQPVQTADAGSAPGFNTEAVKRALANPQSRPQALKFLVDHYERTQPKTEEQNLNLDFKRAQIDKLRSESQSGGRDTNTPDIKNYLFWKSQGGQGGFQDYLAQKKESANYKEYQTKDAIYADRMARTNAAIDNISGIDPKTGVPGRGAYNPADTKNAWFPDSGYLGLANAFNSKEWQQYQQAAREGIAAILRKDTGAAVTETEWELYYPMLYPQPGDGPDVVRQKRESRAAAFQGMKGSSQGAYEAMYPPGLAAPSGNAGSQNAAPPAAGGGGGMPDLSNMSTEQLLQLKSQLNGGR